MTTVCPLLIKINTNVNIRDALLEMPSREKPGPISENSELLGLPHVGHLRVGECVNSPSFEALLGCSRNHDACAA